MKNDPQFSQDGAELQDKMMATAAGDSPLIVEKLDADNPSAERAGKSGPEHAPAEKPATEKPAVEKAKPNRPAFNSSPTALQDLFLNGLRREAIDVVLYFTDGSQERGVLRAFDTFTLLVENRNSGKSQLVYKHAITRIFPVRTPSDLVDRAAKTKTS